MNVDIDKVCYPYREMDDGSVRIGDRLEIEPGDRVDHFKITPPRGSVYWAKKERIESTCVSEDFIKEHYPELII